MNTSLIDERLSLGVSLVPLLLYAANLIYTLVTHRDVFAGDAPSGDAEWSVARALVVMTAATAVIAIQSELVSAALEAASPELGLSPVFLGAVVLALVGTVSDLFAAVVFARRLGDSDRSRGRAGAGAGVVARRPADEPGLQQSARSLAIAGAAFIVRAIAADGETTWFEGLLLIGVYLLFALAYYFASPV